MRGRREGGEGSEKVWEGEGEVRGEEDEMREKGRRKKGKMSREVRGMRGKEGTGKRGGKERGLRGKECR